MTDPQETLKPRVEVVEESQETLDVLELERLPRREKMAREQRTLENAHEVRFAERAFVPKRAETLDDIRSAVDALAPKRASFPEVRMPAPLPPAPEPEPEIPAELRAALEPVVAGRLVAAETKHRDEAGLLVEATSEGADGVRTTSIYAILGGVARPLDDISARIDDLPTPTVRPEPPAPVAVEPEAAPAPAPQDPPATPEKKGAFARFGRKKKEAAPEQPAKEPAAPPSDEAPKRRFGLGRKKG